MLSVLAQLPEGDGGGSADVERVDVVGHRYAGGEVGIRDDVGVESPAFRAENEGEAVVAGENGVVDADRFVSQGEGHCGETHGAEARRGIRCFDVMYL